uniref:Brix domain containing protein n=1 Tax=Haemonchus contortus TaxID=6289 RepID=W6NEM7_HAECO
MIRRENRLRREYIYRKSLEEKQRAIEEKREKIKDALENNKKIDTALRKDAIELANGAEWGGQIMSIDDEYRWAGTKDPKIVITTSREPSSKLKVFVKEMKLVFPNAQRLNRGHYDVKQLVQACRANDVTDFILLTETRGNPDGMVVCHLPFGPTAYFTLFNVVMRHDIPDREPMSEQYPHLIFHNLDSKLGRRFTSILKYLFPVPKENSKRVITFANFDDFISFRHHTYTVVQGGEIELKEAGPRFELRPYAIKLGTLENIAAAEDEWVLRSFMNTSRKRQLLSNKEEESDEED